MTPCEVGDALSAGCHGALPPPSDVVGAGLMIPSQFPSGAGVPSEVVKALGVLEGAGGGPLLGAMRLVGGSIETKTSFGASPRLPPLPPPWTAPPSPPQNPARPSPRAYLVQGF